MREIKFRAWYIPQKRWTHNDFAISFMGEMVCATKEGCLSPVAKDGFIFMQYTGLKDKNGKEAYFDDYVRLSGNVCIWRIMQDDFGIPVFHNITKNHTTYDVVDFKDFFLNHKRDDFEIIGNYYETPELREAT